MVFYIMRAPCEARWKRRRGRFQVDPSEDGSSSAQLQGPEKTDRAVDKAPELLSSNCGRPVWSMDAAALWSGF